MTVVSRCPRRGRNVELLLIVAATAIVLLAYVNVGVNTHGEGAQQPARPGGGFLGIAPAFHLVPALAAATPTRSCCPSPPSSTASAR